MTRPKLALTIAVVVACLVIFWPRSKGLRPKVNQSPQALTQVYVSPRAPESAAPGSPPPLGKKAAATAALLDETFGITRVHRLEVTLARAEWDAMQRSTLRGGGGGIL